ncbi:MAG: DUF4910 domain-containing protein [Pyrinomonadaceae bacterium]|nr:DUF4910 domain-containing protein [Pyrinomonadaceae bacterium]
MHESLSGEIAKDHVIQITRHSRIQGSRQFRASAIYVVGQLVKAGFDKENLTRESFKSDGKVTYQTWQSPSGFDMEWAELRLMEPYEERIVGYPEVAMSLITYSNPGSATAELVFVGSGTSESDYEGKDVKDKIVLATGYGGSVHRLAVLKYGAKAVVCYLDDDRAKQYPDMLAYTGMWPKTDELERVTFGFNLTNRQGEKLRKLIESGQKVVVKGEAKGIGLEPYFMDVIDAKIPGSEKPEEEIVFSAHLDHPKESANDNASGSAALLDIARTLQQGIDNGTIDRPKRTIRFLWVPEWYGTMAYIDKYENMKGVELGGKYLANLNMDMVGEDLEKLHSKLIITRTPDSIPSVLNDVVADMAKMVDKMNVRTPRGSLSAMNYRITPYSGGSDHMMFIERKIPGIMFSHSPDYTHHTSEDTPDKVDPVELERTEIIATSAALYLSNLTNEQAAELAHLAYSNSTGRFSAHFARAMGMISNGSADTGSFADAQIVLRHAWVVERKTVQSILIFNDSPETKEVIEPLLGELNRQYETYSGLLNEKAKALGLNKAGAVKDIDRRVPVRLTRGPLDFGLPESKVDEESAEFYSDRKNRLSGSAKFELANFVDGARNVTQIRNALTAEFGPVEERVVARYLEDLVKIGVMEWRAAE